MKRLIVPLILLCAGVIAWSQTRSPYTLETLTGKREVGIVISNTHARVTWNGKDNDYVQESVVFGQALEREPAALLYTNRSYTFPMNITNGWPYMLR